MVAPKHPWNPKAQRGLVGIVRAWVALPLCILWCFLWLIPMTLVSFIPPLWRKWMGWMARAWGQVPLLLCGVKIITIGKEHRNIKGAKILLPNHVNLFDLFVLSSVWQIDTSVVFKKEFLKIPLMGKVMVSLGMLPIDRSNRKSAIQSLRSLSQQVRDEERAVLMFPEGTRSKNGNVQTFKKGAFHIALQTKAPLLPILTQGMHQIMPEGSFVAYSGTIRMVYLPLIPTDSWAPSNMDENIKEVRRQFLDWLPGALNETGY